VAREIQVGSSQNGRKIWTNIVLSGPSQRCVNVKYMYMLEIVQVYLNPILLTYSRSSSAVNRSVPVQFAELVLALNRPVLLRNNSSIFKGRIAPKTSSGLIVLWTSNACLKSGDCAQDGGSNVRGRSSSSESEYSLLMSGNSMLSLLMAGGARFAACS
jgi:hypothetical protein